MTKFNTTNSNLFSNNNKQNVPDWMSELSEIESKEKKPLDIDFDKRGVFAEKTTVYREELNAEPRYLDKYNKNKMIVDAKIMLSKFLTGKKYNVSDSSVVGDNISLSVEISDVAAQFNFPFQVSGTKLQKTSTFYVNDVEYPFSSAGFGECLSDLKSGTLKKTAISRNMENGYVINREEIVRRYNGSLRQATDKIDQLLKDGTIVGVGSNSYGTFFSVDELFPQQEKTKPQERLAEFHFAPNQEHISTNEYKSADYLKVEAAKTIGKYFSDFKFNESQRDSRQLKIKATVMNKSGLPKEMLFVFDIQDEKLSSQPEVIYEKNKTNLLDVKSKINNEGNDVVERYAALKNIVNKIDGKYILTKKDIENKLFKVANVSKVDKLIEQWINKSLIQPINSETYATKKTFSELLNLAEVEVVSNSEYEEIEEYEKKFGSDVGIDYSSTKPQDHRAQIDEIESSNERKVFNINNYISKRLKNYKVSSIKAQNKNTYKINIDLVNKDLGTKQTIPLEVVLENNGVKYCYANISGNKIELEKLLNSFSTSKILSLYLQNSSGRLNAGPILMTEAGVRNKLSKVVTASMVDDVLEDWISSGKLTRLDNRHLASEHSFQDLLLSVDDSKIKTISELEEDGYQSNHFGKQIKVKTDNKEQDTGVRDIEDNWSEERNTIHASNKISKIFKEHGIMLIESDDSNFYVLSKVKNPLSGMNLSLKFLFKNNDGKLGDMLSVSDHDEAFTVDRVANLLDKHTSDATKHYLSYNKNQKINKNVLINKSSLYNKLSLVTAKEKISGTIDSFINKGFIQPINSTTYASSFSINELISVASNDLDVDAAKNEMNLYRKEENQIQISENRVLDNDTREIKETSRELDEKLSSVKEKLVTYTYKAAKDKKITMNKCGSFLSDLENAKSIYDLEKVSKELKRYYK